MDKTRRDFLTLGTATAIAAASSGAQAQGALPAGSIVVPADDRLRLVSYRTKEAGVISVGVVRANGRIADITSLAKSMVSLIEAGPAALDTVRKLAASAGDTGPLVSDVTLLAPIPEIRRNIYAVGWNYLAHFEESASLRKPGEEPPAHPVFFSKAVHTLNTPFGAIPYDPNVSTQIDWECELAIIIGKRCLNASEASALDYVFGYTVINDTTARDLQRSKHGGQWFKGKSLDGHGPMGPWIAPAADLDYNNLHLLLRVNGAVKQDASTKQMYFKVPRIIAELSQGLTLEPGDIIATGTPPGIGAAMTPPQYLKPGDIMETEIAEIGTMRHVIGSA